MTGCSLLFTMKVCGHTMFMMSCSTTSDAADVLMLKPARSSSSAMVAVPPEDRDAVDAPLDPGAMTMTEMDTATAAMAAQAERGNSQLMGRTLLASDVSDTGWGVNPARPGLASFHRLEVVLQER